MEILGSMLRRTWNNNDKKKTLNNDDDDLSSWEIINPNTPHDNHDHDHDHDVLQQKQLSTKYDIDRPRLDDNVRRLVVGSHDDHTTSMVSDELEPFRIDPPGPSSSSAFTHPFPIINVICDPVCNRRLDEEEDQVHESINYDVEDDNDDEEYDYDYDDDSQWLRKQRMAKVGKKVNNGMMKKSNKLPRYFYNKFA